MTTNKITSINRHQLENLYQHQVINEQTRELGLSLIEGPRHWHQWMERLLLTLGTALILAAVMFFFAFNWDELGNWGKFAIIQGGILLSLIGAVIPWRQKLINQTLMLAASFLVGVLLAIIGQTYQTGADAWSLFAIWSALIIPWVLLSKFTPHWALWLVVTNLALGLYMQQTMALPKEMATLIPLAHAALNGAMLALLLYARKHFAWANGIWTQRILAIALIINLCALAIASLISFNSWSPLALLITAALIGVQALLFYLSRDRWRDFIIHACLIIALAIEGEGIIFKLIFTSKNWGTGSFFLASLVTLVMFTSLVTYLYKAHQQIESGEEQQS